MNEIQNKECFETFIDEMRSVLKSHNPSKGNSWRNQEEHELVDNLLEEVREFEIKNSRNSQQERCSSCYGCGKNYWNRKNRI